MQLSVGEATAVHWLVKSQKEVSALVREGDVRKMGNILADAEATDAATRSARGQRSAVPLPLLATYAWGALGIPTLG